METAERVFPSNQFYLPPPSLQENDLMRGQVEAIGHQAELMTADGETDQAQDRPIFVAPQFDDLITDRTQSLQTGMGLHYQFTQRPEL